MSIFNVHGIPSVICALFLLFLGYYVFFANKSKTNFLFSCLTLSAAIWQIGTALAILSVTPEIAFFWTKFSYIGVTFIPVTMFHFVVSILGIKRYDKHIAASYLLALFVFIPLTWANIFLNGVYQYPWGYWFKATSIHPVYILSYSSLFFINLLLLYFAYRQKYRHDKEKIKYLLVALFISYGGALDYLTDYGINIYPIGYIFVVVCLSVIAYAITKTELMDIRIAISRALAYSISGGLLIFSFIGLNVLHMPMSITMATNALLALFWAFATHRLRDFVQTPLEEKWITGWYDPNKLVNQIAQKLVPVLERDEAFKVVAEGLKNTIKIKKVDILNKPECSDTQEVKRDGKTVVIPFKSSEGVEGGLRLAEKVSEDPYDEKDLLLFRTLQVQILAILDRIRPYERVKKDFEATQQKLIDTERVLARSERIAALANLIREYNHEIKTPLSIIRGEAALLVKEPRDAQYLEWFKNLVFEQVDRANDIVENTLRLSQPKEHKEVDLNLNEVIEASLSSYPPSGVHLVKELHPLPIIKGDQDDLQIVIINLLKNAVEAMTNGGELKIKSYPLQEGDKSLLAVEISDTGVGIAPENFERIFEPFFSTHVTKGRGLGLSTSFRIIREHLGKIEVKSQAGKGSTFTVKLPQKN